MRIVAPDCRLQFPYSEDLAVAVERTGLTTRALARRIGIDSGKLRSYMSGHRECPYPVQFTIEALAKSE